MSADMIANFARAVMICHRAELSAQLAGADAK
jgi:hypothetical protein